MTTQEPNLLLTLLEAIKAGDGQMNPIEVLHKIRPEVSPKEQNFIDIILKFHEIRLIMDKMQ